jgi:EAL domain-containing protein (putative c-di-GMP-specific phosphodiesterase class I)
VLCELLQCLDTHDLPGDRLVVEITESALATDLGRLAGSIGELRDRGVSVAIDDFGIGHSSLSRLTQLPISTLKIDRSFISDIPSSAEAATLVTTIIQLAQNLAMEPIAEGIETETQREFLLERGCTLGQGFLFSRALPVDQLETLLLERRRPSAVA